VDASSSSAGGDPFTIGHSLYTCYMGQYDIKWVCSEVKTKVINAKNMYCILTISRRSTKCSWTLLST